MIVSNPIEQTNALYVKKKLFGDVMLFKILYIGFIYVDVFVCGIFNRAKYPRQEPREPCGRKDHNAFGGNRQHVDRSRLQAQFH